MLLLSFGNSNTFKKNRKAMEWFYAAEGRQRGPYDSATFEDLVQRGVIQSATLVWHKDLPSWRPWSEVQPDSGIRLPPADVASGTAISPIGVLDSDVLPESNPDGQSEEVSAQGQRVTCSECGQKFPNDETLLLFGKTVCTHCKSFVIQRLQEGRGVTLDATDSDRRFNQQEIEEREYSVDATERIAESWRLNFSNPSQVLVAGILGLLVLIVFQGIAGVLSVFPVLGVIASQFIGTGATFLLMGGMLTYYAETARGLNPTQSRVLGGFTKRLLPLLMASLPLALAQAAMMLPTLFFGISGITPIQGVGPGAPTMGLSVNWGGLFLLGSLMLAGFVVYLYLDVHWMYAPALVFEKGYSWIDALKLSYRVVHRHPWQNLWLRILTGILTMASMLVCGIGLLIGFGVAVGALGLQYNRLFGDLQPQVPEKESELS